MKIRRYKKVNRYMNFYVNNFSFREPYQMLLDGTFCFAALNNQVNISDVIPRYLQAELKLLTTQCVLVEMENLGSKVVGALLILKQFAVHKCGHEGKPVPGADCLLSMVRQNNEKHYVVATQDRDLQRKVRGMCGVPLVYLHQKAPVLERPSDVSFGVAGSKVGLSELEAARINELKKESGIVEEVRQFKRKKKKGANPLSCKKKKKVGVTSGVEKAKDIKERRGRKVRIPKHVKECLLVNK